MKAMAVLMLTVWLFIPLTGASETIQLPGNVLSLPGAVHVALDFSQPLSSSSGSVVAWIKPMWNKSDARSHTILSFRWQGEDSSYFALSQGWWEPAGDRKLYFVLSNRDYAFCYMPGEFDYDIFIPDQWTMVAATWSAGHPGYVRLYVDGRQVCERRSDFTGTRQSKSVLYVGSDEGATDRRERASDFVIRDLRTYPQVLSETQIFDRYRQEGGEPHRKWVRAILANNSVSEPLNEPRIMFDEDAHWGASRFEIEKTIKKLKLAGINTYVPCVWNGGQALFNTSKVPLAKSYQAQLSDTYDPLRYLIEVAHREGIAVILWFDVVRRDGSFLPAEYYQGAPVNAFNVHDSGFRSFIVGLISEAVAHYDIDGINLDYVRSMGVCSSSRCEAAYRKEYGRSLRQDWQEQESGKTIPSLVQWHGNAVSAIVYAVADSIRAIKPRLHISVDTIPFDHSRRHQGVDVSAWLAKGAIDSVVYMAYEEPLDIDRITQAWRAIPPGKLVVLIKNFDLIGGEAVDHPGEVVADYVRLTRVQWPEAGVGFYHYPHLSWDQVDVLKSAVFAHPAENGWSLRGCSGC